jgi:outer membrane receptor protein involved in Fe transport
VSRLWQTDIAGLGMGNTLGLQWRHDRLSPVGLYSAEGGQRSGTTQQSRVRETSAGLYGQNDIRWTPWLRSVAGLRVDHVNVDVDSSIAANSGTRSAWVNSPKLSLIFGPWSRTEFFANTGQGFHSNDARGMTAKVRPSDGEATDAAVPLVRTRGSELGMRSEWLPGLQTSLSLWQLKLGSELVFSGDAGDTEASGASRRHGVEFNNHYIARHWLLFDADLAFSQARFDQPQQGEGGQTGRYVPGSVRKVASFGMTLTELGPWFGQLQVRYFGPRPLVEDNSVRSKGTTLTYARVGYKFSPDIKLALDVFNLFDRKVSDIDYYYASRLKGEAEDVFGVHSHPAEPRTVRLTLTANF